MENPSKCFRKCLHPCPRFLTPNFHQDVLSLASSYPADSMLLVPSGQGEVVVEGKDIICTEPSEPASPTWGAVGCYGRVITRSGQYIYKTKSGSGTGREKHEVAHGRFDPLALPHEPTNSYWTPCRGEVIVEEIIFSSHLSIQTFKLWECRGVTRARICEDAPVEERLVSYLSKGESSSMKAPACHLSIFAPLRSLGLMQGELSIVGYYTCISPLLSLLSSQTTVETFSRDVCSPLDGWAF